MEHGERDPLTGYEQIGDHSDATSKIKLTRAGPSPCRVGPALVSKSIAVSLQILGTFLDPARPSKTPLMGMGSATR